VFIVIDALRTRNLGCYGYTKPTSPNIDNLARTGVLFERHYSAINTTDPSLTTIFSGKYPVSHGIINHGSQRKEELATFYASRTVLLPEVLSAQGYRTMAIDWLGRWHTRGYDYYSGILLPENTGKTRPQRIRNGNAKTPVGRWIASARASLPSLKKRAWPKPLSRSEVFADAASICRHAADLTSGTDPRPFLLFMHFWDTHWSYACPQEFSQRLYDPSALPSRGPIPDSQLVSDMQALGLSVAGAVARYDGAIAYVDHCLGQLLHTLATRGVLDKTLVVITADHGESLGEHGIFFEHHGLYDQTIHVPLIVKHPRLPSGLAVQTTTRHVDILPTLLDFLGLESPADVDGHSFLPAVYGHGQAEPSFVFAEERHFQDKAMLATSRYKYVRALAADGQAACRRCHTVHGGAEELYDLEQDPGEEHNIALERADVAADFKGLLSEYVTSLTGKREANLAKAALGRLKAEGRM